MAKREKDHRRRNLAYLAFRFRLSEGILNFHLLWIFAQNSRFHSGLHRYWNCTGLTVRIYEYDKTGYLSKQARPKKIDNRNVKYSKKYRMQKSKIQQNPSKYRRLFHARAPRLLASTK